MVAAASRHFLLAILLTSTATMVAAQDRTPVRVEAIVGEAVVVFEDIDCPEEIVEVPTGQVAVTYPEECETVVSINTVPDPVGDVIWAIANTDPDDAEAIEQLLVGLTTSEQTLVLVVLINNSDHLGTDTDTLLATITAITRLNPDATPLIVLTGIVLDPENQDDIITAALIGAPDQVDEIDDILEVGDEIINEFQDNQPPGPDEEDPNIEVIEVEDEQPAPPDIPRPPINNQVPPGGVGPTPTVTPTPTPTVSPTPTPTVSPTPTPTVSPTPTPTVSPTPTPTVSPTPTPTVSPTPTPTVSPTPTPTISPTPTPTPTPTFSPTPTPTPPSLE